LIPLNNTNTAVKVIHALYTVNIRHTSTIFDNHQKASPSMDHIARKRFGQNFLQDRIVIDRIVHDVAPQAGELMAEIGPGLGALTLPLLNHQPNLHVVEIDRDLAAYWRAKQLAHLTVNEMDALRFDFAALAAQSPTGKLRVVGNLPYNISSPLLFQLQSQIACITDQHFMLQREVVDRMVASAGNSDFSRLSVMLQATYAMTRLQDVPPTAFEPAPRVWSAVVRMVPLAQPVVDAALWPAFANIVAQAFSQRRKMLRGVLKPYLAQLEQVGIAGTLRAEDVTVAQFAALARLI
jgi:16S rRNA (adenine1518-N6/adenine1519-N6)-dimethyltransferase